MFFIRVFSDAQEMEINFREAENTSLLLFKDEINRVIESTETTDKEKVDLIRNLLR